MTANPAMCPYCNRKKRTLKNSTRRGKHYINLPMGWGWGEKLHECKGSNPTEGRAPSPALIEEMKKDSPKIRCRRCDTLVPRTDSFRPAKHYDYGRGQWCKGWSDNQ